MGSTDEPKPIIFVIDDDALMRVALTYLFRSMNFDVVVFASAPELLQSELPDLPSCLVSTSACPANGLEFQERFVKSDIHIPIVFRTGHGDLQCRSGDESRSR